MRNVCECVVGVACECYPSPSRKKSLPMDKVFLLLFGLLAFMAANRTEAGMIVAGTSGKVEFASVNVAPGGANAVFGNGNFIRNGQVLIAPGNGFDRLNGAVDDLFATNFALPAQYYRTGANAAAITTETAAANPLGLGGGGVFWPPPTGIAETGPLGGVSAVSASEATATFTAVGAGSDGTFGSAMGVSGFVPTGSWGAVALTGTVTFPNATFAVAPIIVAITGGGPPGTDFVTPNTFSGLTVVPEAGGVEFSAYGVSIGGAYVLAAGAHATADFTLTFIADPQSGLDISFDPQAIPRGAELPDFGGFGGLGSAAPEPSSAVLLSLGGLGLFGLVRKRRQRIAE